MSEIAVIVNGIVIGHVQTVEEAEKLYEKYMEDKDEQED